jgi:hypothetical protein
MPVDPAITQGQLSNGLRYYVRANKKPEKRAELRLVVPEARRRCGAAGGEDLPGFVEPHHGHIDAGQEVEGER